MIKYIELGKKIYDTSNPREQRRMVVFVLRAMWHDADMKKLMAFFEGNEVLKDYIEKSPFPLEQVTRAFFYKGSTFKERMRIICDNYDFFVKILNKDSFFRSCSYVGDKKQRGINLWKYEVDKETLYVRLFSDAGQRKEGMISLQLILGMNYLYQVDFWIARDWDNQYAVWIGALQGPNVDDAKGVIKKMTKVFHGYRTKNLAIHLLRLVGKSMGVSKIYAVTNEGYYANNHARMDRKLKTSFSDFWRELGGIPSADDRFFVIPTEDARKKTEDIPTRKRAVYKRRYALLDLMESDVKIAMSNILR